MYQEDLAIRFNGYRVLKRFVFRMYICVKPKSRSQPLCLQAKELAKQENKPIVALVHKTWCGACKQLKKDFQSGGAGVDRVVKASASYIMVNLEDDEGEGISDLKPEGAGYIPRVVFFTPDGTARPDIKSKANPNYAYFYPNADSLGQVMESSLSMLKSSASEL